ncbi:MULTISPECIES: PAS domain-containing protein [Bradyrhizobium]|uniref:PAS domain-containing protein n=1 Tax=Bradyrhizobium vignae TaxID=1549949 RepID=A0A2U3Q3N1_9BRAD|nr:PAS domain-containing protein [Bradyrhizobium vignae]SPP95948.1 conserved protein of unknown function [Bradyrhizobium vignae]
MYGSSRAENIALDFASAAPSVVKSIRQRDLLNTWLRLYARRQIAPAIWEYQPVRLEEELSDLIYYTVEFSTPTTRLIIQSEGTRISRAYGHTGKGVPLDDYVGPRHAPFVIPIYHECVARGLPVYSVADVDDVYGRIVAYERLLLPFQTDGKVCHVIASVKTFCEDGGFEIKNLMRGNDALPRPKMRAVIDRELFHRAPGRIAPAETVEFADQPGSGIATGIIELN